MPFNSFLAFGSNVFLILVLLHVFAVVLCLGPTNMAPIWLQKVGFENNRLLDSVIF